MWIYENYVLIKLNEGHNQIFTKNSTNNWNIIRRSFSYLILFYWSTYLHLWHEKTSLLFLICKVQIVLFVYLMRHSKESQIKRLTFTNTNSIQRKYLDIMCNFIAIMLAPKRIFTLYSLNWASSILGFSYLLGLLKKVFSYLHCSCIWCSHSRNFWRRIFVWWRRWRQISSWGQFPQHHQQNDKEEEDYRTLK